MNDLSFDIIQKPGTIHMNVEPLKEQLREKMEEYASKVFAEEDKKDAKDDLAFLRSIKKAVNERRIEVKKEYMKPCDLFEKEVAELIYLIDGPIGLINGQVKEFEEKRIREKNAEIQKIYDELVEDELQDYIPLECIYSTKWGNAGTTLKSIRREIESVVVKTSAEINAIKAINSDKKEAALNIYMATRNLPAAMKCIADYEKQKDEILKKQETEQAERAERERQKEIERIRKEERERIRSEEKIRLDAEKSAIETLKTVDEDAAAPLSTKESRKVIYTVVATPDELQEIEMAFTSLGVYFERKDV